MVAAVATVAVVAVDAVVAVVAAVAVVAVVAVVAAVAKPDRKRSVVIVVAALFPLMKPSLTANQCLGSWFQ